MIQLIVDRLSFIQASAVWLKKKNTNSGLPSGCVSMYERQTHQKVPLSANRLIRSAILTKVAFYIPMLSHSHNHSNTDGTAIWSNLGFSIQLKDTTIMQLEPGTKPPTLQSWDYLVCLLSHSQAKALYTVNALHLNRNYVNFQPAVYHYGWFEQVSDRASPLE